MATERPEKLDSKFVVRVDGPTLSTPAHIELMRLVLGRGRNWRIRALGKSMTPFIRHGDDITFAPVSAERGIGLGDVVAHIRRLPTGTRLVVHRVVGRRGSSYLIRPDPGLGYNALPVPPSDILGRVVRVERGGKRIKLGLGLERYVIAVLSRAGLLLPLLRHVGIGHRR